MTTLVERLNELREKATPGPWKITEGHAPGSVTVRVDGEFPRPVLEIWHNGDAPQDNAALVVELVNNLDTIISALVSSEEGMEWQSIETAPKDGTVILGLEPEKFTRIRETWWFAPSSMTQEWLCRERPGSWHPTHWMPLPKSPTSIKEV